MIERLAQGVPRPAARRLMHAMDYPREHLTPAGFGSACCPYSSDFPEHRLPPLAVADQERAMEFIHADTYEDAQREIQRRRASTDGATLMYKIVRSRYKGFDVVAIAPELYTDMLEGELVDGLPSSPLLGNLRSSGWGT